MHCAPFNGESIPAFYGTKGFVFGKIKTKGFSGRQRTKADAFAKVGVSFPNTGKGGSLSAVNEVVSTALGLSQPSKVPVSGYQSAVEVWTVHRGLSRCPLPCQFRSLFPLNLPSLLCVPLASASSHPLLPWGRAHIDPFRLLNFSEKHWLQLPSVYHC